MSKTSRQNERKKEKEGQEIIEIRQKTFMSRYGTDPYYFGNKWVKRTNYRGVFDYVGGRECVLVSGNGKKTFWFVQ